MVVVFTPACPSEGDVSVFFNLPLARRLDLAGDPLASRPVALGFDLPPLLKGDGKAGVDLRVLDRSVVALMGRRIPVTEVGLTFS